MMLTYLNWILFALVPYRKPQPPLSLVLKRKFVSVILFLTILTLFYFLSLAAVDLAVRLMPALFPEGTMVPSVLPF